MNNRLPVSLLLILTCFCAPSSHSIRIARFPAISTVITRITNGTIDVLQGVSGVVQGSLSMISSTITQIVDGAGSVRDKIVRLLEEFRKYMQRGIPELGIPVLEPLVLDRIDLNIESPEIGVIRGYALNVEIRHLSQFRIDQVSLDRSNRLTLNITFPHLDVKGKYLVFGNIGGMARIVGKGPFWLKLHGLSIGTLSQLRYNYKRNPSYYVESMRIGIKLKGLSNHFYGLMSDRKLEDLINKVVSKVTPEALEILWPEIEPSVSRDVVNIVNDKLKDFQIGSIIARLLNVFSINPGRINVHT